MSEPKPVTVQFVYLVLALLAVFVLLAFLFDRPADREAIDQGFLWLQRFAGIAVLLWSGKKVEESFRLGTAGRALGTTPALAGALAGSILLGVGTWAAPAAIGILGVTEGYVRLRDPTARLMVQKDRPAPSEEAMP